MSDYCPTWREQRAWLEQFAALIFQIGTMVEDRNDLKEPETPQEHRALAVLWSSLFDGMDGIYDIVSRTVTDEIDSPVRELLEAEPVLAQDRPDWEPDFSERWRHGGWYVGNLRWPNGGVGCVSNNFADKRWRIACDPRPFEQQPSFKTRREAAFAERDLLAGMVPEEVPA